MPRLIRRVIEEFEDDRLVSTAESDLDVEDDEFDDDEDLEGDDDLNEDDDAMPVRRGERARVRR